MRQYSQSGNQASRRQLRERLERVFGELNIYLAAFAIGLAILDMTCFYARTLDGSLSAALRREAKQSSAWPGIVFPPAPATSEDDPG